MSNDYEFLEASQVPPPVAPRPPTDAPADLISGLPHTPALKANDDVDLESNRPRGENNLSFSDNVNPKRSEPSVAVTKTSRSSESDEESKKESKNDEKEERKPAAKWGTCWCIFAGITIFLAVISLLGLGAFLIMNMSATDDSPISQALNGTNETSTAALETTTPQIILAASVVPELVNNSSTTEQSETKTTSSLKIEKSTVPSNGTSTVSANETSTVTTTTIDSEETTTSDPTPLNLPDSSIPSDNSTVPTEPTEKIEEALPIEMTTQSNFTVESSTSSVENLSESSTTASENTENPDELPATDAAFPLLLNETSTDTTRNGTSLTD